MFLDDTNTLWTLGRNDFDGGKIVFLPPDEKPFVTVTNQTSVKFGLVKFGYNGVEIVADANEPSLVVVAQTYYHNWRATIDGQPAKLLRANAAFQAVQIPAGGHIIRLIYRDRAFEAGALISGIGWICGLSVLVVLRRRKAG
jgi:uncharacterized membrane protein YfhO